MTAVRKHEKGQKHVEKTSLVLSSKTNNNGQRSIENALSRAESISIQQRKIKDQAHIAEAMLVSCFSRHSLPESMYDCFNVLLPIMIPDSMIVKEMKLGRTKAGYLLTEGLAPHYHQLVVSAMKKHPFSVNFDESTVNKSQQLNNNVAIRNEYNRIEKHNFTTLELTDGTTGIELANMVIAALESEDITLLNMISDQTDGCAAML